jgi:chromosome segregation ATPase
MLTEEERKRKSLEVELARCQKALKEENENAISLRELLSEVDSERDRLRSEVDRQAEHISEIESKL